MIVIFNFKYFMKIDNTQKIIKKICFCMLDVNSGMKLISINFFISRNIFLFLSLIGKIKQKKKKKFFLTI